MFICDERWLPLKLKCPETLLKLAYFVSPLGCAFFLWISSSAGFCQFMLVALNKRWNLIWPNGRKYELSFCHFLKLASSWKCSFIFSLHAYPQTDRLADRQTHIQTSPFLSDLILWQQNQDSRGVGHKEKEEEEEEEEECNGETRGKEREKEPLANQTWHRIKKGKGENGTWSEGNKRTNSSYKQASKHWRAQFDSSEKKNMISFLPSSWSVSSVHIFLLG